MQEERGGAWKRLVRIPVVAGLLLGAAWVLSVLLQDFPLFLKFLHVIAFITLGSGLIGVLVSDFRARRSRTFVELLGGLDAVLMFYYRLVVPGSMLILLSGFSMVFAYYSWAALETPWIAGMMVLFIFEFLEGHLFMGFHYFKLRAASVRAREAGEWTPQLEAEVKDRLCVAAHFLDVPNFFLIVSIGVLRPESWTHFMIGVVLVIAVTATLNHLVGKHAPWRGISAGASGAAPVATGIKLGDAGA
ncbi:MAG: DUF2269 family protein [Hyphomonadaceae bacterium]